MLFLTELRGSAKQTIHHDGIMVANFVSHSFSRFNDLKIDNTMNLRARMVSFDWFLISFQKKLILSTFNSGSKVLDV